VGPIVCLLCVVGVMTTNAAPGQQPPALQDLAKLRANPLSGLHNVTLQEDANFGFPSGGQVQHVVSLQAVWSFPVGKDWSLIAYPIGSFISQPALEPGESEVNGLGNTVLTALLTPKETGTLIWGAGPVLVIPTTTDRELGSDLWAAGPALALFVQPDPWTVGVLLENAWSFAGSGSGKINAFEAQYFLTYNLPRDWFVESNATITADWEADKADRWTVPVGGGFGNVFTIGSQSVSPSVQAFYNAVSPRSGPDWSVSFALQLLFPE